MSRDYALSLGFAQSTSLPPKTKKQQSAHCHWTGKCLYLRPSLGSERLVRPYNFLDRSTFHIGGEDHVRSPPLCHGSSWQANAEENYDGFEGVSL